SRGRSAPEPAGPSGGSARRGGFRPGTRGPRRVSSHARRRGEQDSCPGAIGEKVWNRSRGCQAPKKWFIAAFGRCRGPKPPAPYGGLEHELGGELDLTGRARVSGRKPRGGDATEVRRAHDPARLGEVGVVEHVERLGAQLQAPVTPQVDVLDDREID